MKQDVIQAIKASIKHWKRLQVFKQRKGEDPSSDSCPLCRIFYNGDGECGDCPVALKTNQNGCKGSPWDYAMDAWTDCDVVSQDSNSLAPRLKVLFRAAQKEINFLTKLLPPEHRPKKKPTK